MKKPSVAAHLRTMNGQPVIMRVSGIPTVDDMDVLREQFKGLLRDNNIPDEQFAEDEHKFFIKEGNQFWMKPKLRREQRGILKVRSKDYLFIPDGKGESQALHGNKEGLTFYPDQVKVEKVANANPRVGGLISYELA